MNIISQSDFPQQWPELVPSLVQKFQCGDMTVITGVLKTAKSIFDRFIGKGEDTETATALRVALDQFVKVDAAQSFKMKELFVALTSAVAPTEPGPAMAQRFECLLTLADIFFALNWVTIPEEFEDEIETWMQGFIKLISFNAAALTDDADAENPGLLERLRFAIVRNLTHYAAKYEEEFARFLPPFTKVILELAARFTSSPMPKHDAVVTQCLQFASKVR